MLSNEVLTTLLCWPNSQQHLFFESWQMASFYASHCICNFLRAFNPDCTLNRISEIFLPGTSFRTARLFGSLYRYIFWPRVRQYAVFRVAICLPWSLWFYLVFLHCIKIIYRRQIYLQCENLEKNFSFSNF